MGIEAVLSAIGLGEFAGDTYFVAQLVLASLSSLLFLCSIIICAMAFRAASAARRARGEAGDLAVEVRHLTAQVENATARRASLRMPEASEEAEADAASGDTPEPAEAAEGELPADRTLEEAKTAATVPSALLRRRAFKRRA